MHSVHLPFQCSKVYHLHINYHMTKKNQDNSFNFRFQIGKGRQSKRLLANLRRILLFHYLFFFIKTGIQDFLLDIYSAYKILYEQLLQDWKFLDPIIFFRYCLYISNNMRQVQPETLLKNRNLPVYKISSLKITPPKTPDSFRIRYRTLFHFYLKKNRLEFRFRSHDFSFKLFPVWQPYC